MLGIWNITGCGIKLKPPNTASKPPLFIVTANGLRLKQLANLFGKKLISQAEYDAIRQQILGEL